MSVSRSLLQRQLRMRETLIMNKKELISALESLGMRPGRGLGQNFLLDANLLEWIVRNCGAQTNENVLEVGPGFGALTEKMVAAKFNVTAIEFDHRLAGFLRKKFADAPNFTLIEADACKVDFNELFPAGTTYRAVANLPYAISSVFIARMLECHNPPSSMFFMLQKEMGERLAASPVPKPMAHCQSAPNYFMMWRSTKSYRHRYSARRRKSIQHSFHSNYLLNARNYRRMQKRFSLRWSETFSINAVNKSAKFSDRFAAAKIPPPKFWIHADFPPNCARTNSPLPNSYNWQLPLQMPG